MRIENKDTYLFNNENIVKFLKHGRNDLIKKSTNCSLKIFPDVTTKKVNGGR